MSEITHEWSGSVLTVTSDSGTSSADLKGPKGDTGPRGPQGPAGILYDGAGNVLVDLAPYATIDYVDAMVDNVEVDLSDYPTKAEVTNTYATKNYVSTEIAKAQMEGAEVDTSGFATKDDLANIEINIDNKTIIQDADGRITTAIGGYSNNGGGVNYSATGLSYYPAGGWNSYTSAVLGNIGKAWTDNCVYQVSMTFKDGETINFTAEFEWVDSPYAGEDQMLAMLASSEESLFDSQNHISCLYVDESGDFYYSAKFLTTDESTATTCEDKWICTAVSVYADGFVPIDGNYIPVDGTTVYLNSEGKLACSVSLGEDGTLDLSNYYTKAEIDALIASGGGVASSEEVSY